jgi:hypothetical protein
VRLATAEGQGAIHAAVQARAGGGPGGARGAGPGGARGGGPGGVARGGGAPRDGGAGPVPGSGAPRASPQVELIKYLAAQGADVNLMAQRNWRYRTRGGSALHYAVRTGNLQIVQAVVELGVDINAKDNDGVTALDYAMGRGHVAFMQQAQPPNIPLADYLRSKGASVELDYTPIWPHDGAPLSTNAYDSKLWPVDPVGP